MVLGTNLVLDVVKYTSWKNTVYVGTTLTVMVGLLGNVYNVCPRKNFPIIKVKEPKKTVVKFGIIFTTKTSVSQVFMAL